VTSGSTFTPGFDCAEAFAMMGLCAEVYKGPTNTTPDPTIGHLPTPQPPAGWTCVVRPTTTVGLDNYWQLWGNTAVAGEYAIVVRGTIMSAKSILDDVLLPLIAAQGTMTMQVRHPDKQTTKRKSIRYVFSRNPFAAVHFGFAFGALALLFQDARNGIWPQMQQLAGPGTRFYVTGHSQGGAIATLLRSFLEHQPVGGLGPESYKTYLFAPPKPGNDQYGFDFDRLTSFPGRAFRVTNTEDWAPQMPLTLQWPPDVSKPNPLSSALVASAIDVPSVAKAVRATSASLKRRARLKMIEAEARSSGVRFLLSLNYDHCGSPVPLVGKHGNNPCNKRDMLWQHHLGMYAHLLRDQLCGERES